MDGTEPFDQETFESVLVSATNIQGEILKPTRKWFKRSKKKDFNQRHHSNSDTKQGYRVLLQNNKSKEQKGRKFAWLGPNVVSEVTSKESQHVKNKMV